MTHFLLHYCPSSSNILKHRWEISTCSSIVQHFVEHRPTILGARPHGMVFIGQYLSTKVAPCWPTNVASCRRGLSYPLERNYSYSSCLFLQQAPGKPTGSIPCNIRIDPNEHPVNTFITYECASVNYTLSADGQRRQIVKLDGAISDRFYPGTETARIRLMGESLLSPSSAPRIKTKYCLTLMILK